jgi:integrase
VPRTPGKVPSYCHHKASGRAVVRIDGRDHYLGPYGCDDSHAEYQRLIAQWRHSRHRQTTTASQAVFATTDPGLTVREVLVRYCEFARGYYSENGETTKEFVEMGYAVRPVRELYGNTMAGEFGPLALKAVRQHMMELDLSRGVINHRVNRIKRFFKWAVSEQLIPPAVHEGLPTVSGLEKGRTVARETEPVRPVDDTHIDPVLSQVSPQVAAMIQLQRRTGMRPGEVVMMRACDIDIDADVWIYQPDAHKMAWRGHRRQIPIGPYAQKVLKPYLNRPAETFLFSPREAETHRNAIRKANRRTPMTPSQSERSAKKHPKRPRRARYDTASYRQAVRYGINKINKLRATEGLEPIPNWCPLQLRHSRATEVNERFGIEAAAVSLGHAHADVTKVYAERNLTLAMKVARETG